MLTTTHWTDRYGNRKVSTEEGQARIKQLLDKDVFRGLMFRSGSTVEHHSGSAADAHRIVSTIIDRRDARRFFLPVQKQMVDEGRTLDNTDAGQALMAAMSAERAKCAAKIAELRQQHVMELAARDREARRQLERHHRELESKLRRANRNCEEMRVSL